MNRKLESATRAEADLTETPSPTPPASAAIAPSQPSPLLEASPAGVHAEVAAEREMAALIRGLTLPPNEQTTA